MYLWLDDTRPEPAGWTRVKTIDEAKALLLTGQVERASLDHDLGSVPACFDCVNAGDGRGCDKISTETGDCDCKNCHHPLPDGAMLTKWMAETGNWPKFKPTVHSQNAVGAAHMRSDIDHYGPYHE